MRKRLALILSLFLAVSFNFYGLAQPCATRVTPAVVNHWNQTGALRNGVSQARRSGPDMVAVKVHIIRQTGGTGGLSVSSLKSIMDNVNTYYSNANIQFYQCGAINYINNSTYYNFVDTDENTMCGANDVANMVNIYFANTVTSGGSAACGYAYYPGGHNRVLMDNSCAINGSTMVHELGHFFYLFHTHETAFGNERVNGSNCTTAGDLLCDTPADPGLSDDSVNTSCVYIGVKKDANGQAYTPQTHNMMSYSRKSCRDLLTTNQYSRIENSNAAYRTGLHNTCTSYDAGVVSIQSISCGTMDPAVVIKNYGNTTLTSLALKYQVDGGSVSNYNWTGSLSPMASTSIVLSLGLSGTHTVKAFTSSPNGNSDVVNYNDTVTQATSTISSSISSFPYSEGFESGFGSWSQSAADNFNWSRISVATPTSGTGPSGAQSGSYYLYTESSSPNSPNKTAILETCVNFTGMMNGQFTFYRHMWGTGMGSFELLASSDNGINWTTLYSKNGNQGNIWVQETINLSAYNGVQIQLRFKVTTLNFESDVAIDNLAITASVAPSLSTWVGTTTTWNTASNWSPAVVPTSNDTISVNGNTANQPVITGGISKAVSKIIFSNGGTININSGNTLTIHNSVNGTASFAGTGTVKFNSGTYSINSATSISGLLQVPTGVTVNTNGNLTLQDGASLMHGTGTTGGGGTVNGSVIVKRTANSGSTAWNIFGSPVSSSGTSVLGNNVYWFNEQNNASSQNNDWQLVSGSMTVGLGYIASGAGNVSFSGTVNNGNLSIPVTVTASGNSSEDGYNCISNPYPSAIDAVAFINANSALIAGENLYFWDNPPTTNFTQGDYATFNKTLGGVAGGAGNSPDGNIGSAQGFFFKANSAGTINFTNALRTSQNDLFFRNNPDDIQRFKISVTNPQQNSNETMIAFKSDATDGLDVNYDAPKTMGNSKLSLYTALNGTAYAIQAFEPAGNSLKTIPIILEGTIAGTYTFDVTMIDNFDETALIFLKDCYAHVSQNLRKNPTYTVSLQPGKYDNRFMIKFYPSLEYSITETSCNGADGAIEILPYNGFSSWSYNLTANSNLISSGTIPGSNVISNLSKGIYNMQWIHNSGYTVDQSITVTGKQNVTAAFKPDTTIVHAYQNLNFLNTSFGANSYEWYFGDGSMSTGINPTHVFIQPGNYEVKLLAENAYCAGETTSSIEVLSSLLTGINFSEENAAFIHTAGNEMFITNLSPTASNFYLYNILGETIYSQTEIPASFNFSLNVADGIYIAKLISDDFQYTRKVQIAR